MGLDGLKQIVIQHGGMNQSKLFKSFENVWAPLGVAVGQRGCGGCGRGPKSYFSSELRKLGLLPSKCLLAVPTSSAINVGAHK